MAGREGFEPPEVLPSTVFKTAALNRSAISRDEETYLQILEATPGFEPGIKALQAHALPLGYIATEFLNQVVPGAGFEPAQEKLPRDFKSLASTNFAIRATHSFLKKLNGAGNEVRTRDPDLGKVVLYH